MRGWRYWHLPARRPGWGPGVRPTSPVGQLRAPIPAVWREGANTATLASGGPDLLSTGCRSWSVTTAGAPSQSSSPSPCADESSDVEAGGVVVGGAVVVAGGTVVVGVVVVVVVGIDESSWPPWWGPSSG